LDHLEHRGDPATSCYHTYVLPLFRLHESCLSVPQKELLVSFVNHISEDPGHLDLSALLEVVHVLAEEPTLRKLKVFEVNFDQQVEVARVCDLAERVVVPSGYFLLPTPLVSDFCLKLQILAGLMAQQRVFLWESETVEPSVCAKLLLAQQFDWKRLFEPFHVPAVWVLLLFQGFLVYSELVLLAQLGD
jgi:hypothetical protein